MFRQTKKCSVDEFSDSNECIFDTIFEKLNISIVSSLWNVQLWSGKKYKFGNISQVNSLQMLSLLIMESFDMNPVTINITFVWKESAELKIYEFRNPYESCSCSIPFSEYKNGVEKVTADNKWICGNWLKYHVLRIK